MRLRTKLLIAFVTPPLFLFSYTFTNVLDLTTIREDVERLQRLIQATDVMSQASAEIAVLDHPEDLEISVTQGSARPGEDPAVVNALTDRAERSLILLRSLRSLAEDPKSQESIDEALRGVDEYRRSATTFAAALVERGSSAARGDERLQAAEAYLALRPLVSRFSENLGRESRRALLALGLDLQREASSQTRNSLIFGLVLTLITATTLASLSVRRFLALHQATRRIAEGDFDLELPADSKDEIGELSAAFNNMTKRLREIYYDLEAQVLKRTEALRRRERELYEAQKLAAIGRLSAGVAHELGGPLTIIASAAEGLADRVREMKVAESPPEDLEDFPEYLETIEGEAYRLKKVVRRLLDFARPAVPVRAPADLCELASSAFDLARLDPRARRVELVFQEKPESAMIQGDADRLQEAILNLIFNALDAAGEGGHVSVSLWLEGAMAILRIDDDGLGIDDRDFPFLFEPFFTTKPEGAGTGLGLSLVAACVEAHEGRVHVESAGPGCGASFEVHLPLMAPASPDDEPGGSSERAVLSGQS